MLRLLFYSAFRCELCGHRHYRFKLLAVAGTVAVVLLITSFFGVANMVSKPYEQRKAHSRSRCGSHWFADRSGETARVAGLLFLVAGDSPPARSVARINRVSRVDRLAHQAEGQLNRHVLLPQTVCHQSTHSRVAYSGRPGPDAAAADIPYLVGDATKLRTARGWTPRVGLEETLRQVLDAAAH